MLTKDKIEKTAKEAWEKCVEGSLRYEDLSPAGRKKFNSAIRYAMRRAYDLHRNW
mgnify:CR=1 FL=1